MECDSGLDFVVDDVPGIGRRYQMTGSNGGRITVIVQVLREGTGDFQVPDPPPASRSPFRSDRRRPTR
jgi:hypothetical protein